MLSPNLICEARIGCDLDITSKKRLLETLAERLAMGHPQLSTETVFERLLERERLGSTSLGHGIALPHARTPAITEVIGAFVRTAQRVDYDSSDGEPVDLAFALLVPDTANDEHLRLLAHLASLFSDSQIRQQLRQADSPGMLLQVLNSR